MGINSFVDAAASQQMAIVANNSAAAGLKDLDEKLLSRDEAAKKNYEESSFEKLLNNSNNPSKAGINIIANLAGKLATLGVTLSSDRSGGKAREAMEEYRQLVEDRVGTADTIDLRVGIKGLQKASNKNSQQEGRGDNGAGAHGEELGGLQKEYAATYAQYLFSPSPETKKKLDRLERELTEKNVGTKELLSIKTVVSNSMRRELAAQVREAYIEKKTSKKNTIDDVVNMRKLNDVLDAGLLKGLHDNESLQAEVDEVVEGAKSDLRDMAKEKIEKNVIKMLVSETDDNKKEITTQNRELLKFAETMGVDLDAFVAKWKEKAFDLGLTPINIPLGQGGQMGAGGNNQQKPSNQEMDYSKEEEKELLSNRLRALNMHRALTGDWKKMLETSFKMKKLKNGLIRLGVNSHEMENIAKEGKQAAVDNLMIALRKTLEERATLYELAGPAYKLIVQKLKGIKSNLERLGVALDEIEYNSMRDLANQRVCNAAVDDLIATRCLLGNRDNPALEKKMTLIIKLIKRLSEESNLSISDEILIEASSIKEGV